MWLCTWKWVCGWLWVAWIILECHSFLAQILRDLGLRCIHAEQVNQKTHLRNEVVDRLGREERHPAVSLEPRPKLSL